MARASCKYGEYLECAEYQYMHSPVTPDIHTTHMSDQMVDRLITASVHLKVFHSLYIIHTRLVQTSLDLDYF